MDGKIETAIVLIKRHFSHLFSNYGFRVIYFTPDYGMFRSGEVIGLESELLRARLVFLRDFDTVPFQIFIAAVDAPFRNYFAQGSGWFNLVRLAGLVSGQPALVCPPDLALAQILDQTFTYVEPSLEKVFALFEKPGQVEEWLKHHVTLHGEKFITQKQIKAEQERLKGLGLDSSPEAATRRLKGGNHG
jgi:hypothetical protein